MTWIKQTAIILISLILGGVMVVLGIWQLDVYHSQGARAAQERLALPPVPLDQVAPPGQQVTEGFGRTVSFTGHYQAKDQLLVPLNDAADRFRVVTALVQQDGTAVAVVRGVVQGQEIPAPPSGQVSEEGVLLPSEDNVPSAQLSDDVISSVRLSVIAQRWSQPVVAGFVTLSSADAAEQSMQADTPVLPEGEGRLRNGAYAFQWWIFAAFAVAMGIKISRDVALADDYAASAAAEIEALSDASDPDRSDDHHTETANSHS